MNKILINKNKKYKNQINQINQIKINKKFRKILETIFLLKMIL